MKRIIVVLFVVMCLAQWIVVAKMVYDSETVISEGTVYKFKTAPVDPADPFRGKFITLRFEENYFQFQDSAEWNRGAQIFVTFKTDSAGFATADQIFHDPPDAESYLQTVVEFVDHYGSDHKVWYKLPFDRLYLAESKASEAEQVYWKTERDSAQVAYALVSIGPGQAVLQDVIVNDRPILDIVNELNESPE